MYTKKLITTVFVVLAVLLSAGLRTARSEPYFLIDTEQEWNAAQSGGHVYAMENEGWGEYMTQWSEFKEEGESYPDDPFEPAIPPTGDLYVYGGGGGGCQPEDCDPEDAGLVMAWHTQDSQPDGTYTYSSAWTYDYGLDPDLRNCTITVTVTAPQLDMMGNQMNQVSLGLQDVTGAIRAWFWNCGAKGSGAPIIWNTPTQLKIDTSKTGLSAATPAANGYMNNPAFNLSKVQWIILDENGTWVVGPGSNPAPAPGSGIVGLWNYWHWLMVTPNTTVDKGIHKKWSQPPVVLDPNEDPPTFSGWDEYSNFDTPPIVADDWQCNDDRPITDIHWWGSYIGWNQPFLPVLPMAFHIGIWTNVPDPNINNPDTFSHPGTLIWENYCDNYVWNFAGFDKDPRTSDDLIDPDPDPSGAHEPNDACFQFTQLLSQDEWFYQEPNEDPCSPTIYWLSIAPQWGGPEPYNWGWKTRPHNFEDDAVSMMPLPWPPLVNVTTWAGGTPIKSESVTWDVAFELTTNQPDPNDPVFNPADFNKDGIVNMIDLAFLAAQWLRGAGP